MPAEAEQAMRDRPVEFGQEQRGGEERTFLVGTADAGIILAVVVTLRGSRIRVVTARQASRAERRVYEESAAGEAR